MKDLNKKELLKRQLRDIILQCERIEKGDNSSSQIENYARYSNELQKYILKHCTNSEILKQAKQIPNINYKRNQYKLWEILLLPFWILSFFKSSIAKNKSLNEIINSKNRFVSILQVLELN